MSAKKEAVFFTDGDFTFTPKTARRLAAENQMYLRAAQRAAEKDVYTIHAILRALTSMNEDSAPVFADVFEKLYPQPEKTA